MNPAPRKLPRLVTAGGHQFWIINGRRVWRDKPPVVLRHDLLPRSTAGLVSEPLLTFVGLAMIIAALLLGGAIDAERGCRAAALQAGAHASACERL